MIYIVRQPTTIDSNEKQTFNAICKMIKCKIVFDKKKTFWIVAYIVLVNKNI